MQHFMAHMTRIKEHNFHYVTAEEWSHYHSFEVGYLNGISEEAHQRSSQWSMTSKGTAWTVASGKEPADARSNRGGLTSYLPPGSTSPWAVSPPGLLRANVHRLTWQCNVLLIWPVWFPQYEVNHWAQSQAVQSPSRLLSLMALCELFNHSGSWILFKMNIEIKRDYT